jgi:hypothetical protein
MTKAYTSILIGAAFASCVAIAPALAECGKGSPAFEDTFQTLDPTWGSPGPEIKVANNALIVSPQPNYRDLYLSQSDFYGDGSLCVLASVSQSTDAKGTNAIVNFWAADYKNLYMLWIGSDGAKGYFQIGRLSNGKWLAPVAWTSDPVIKFNIGDVNAVEIQMAGRVATVMINGKKVTQFTGAPPDGGGLIGLGCENDDKVTGECSFQKLQFFKAAAP